MMATVPFDPPSLLTARRKAGFVDVPDAKDESRLNWDGNASTVDFDHAAAANEPEDRMAGPGLLKRTQTMAGNIIVFEEDGKPPQAFWIQRKIGKSSSGVMRLGYKLRPNTKPEFKDATEAWELATDGSGIQPIVIINMMHSSVLDQKTPDDEHVVNPRDELSALQMIANNGNFERGHVVGTRLIATCSQHVYAVLPYHPDGTLFQFCLLHGSMDEPVARFLFRQILDGVKTMQDVGLCHRNLTLDNLELSGDHLSICRLAWSLRFNKGAPVDEDKPVPAPGGDNPQYIAPEYFGGPKGFWDGFAADLWACGLMLYSMVVSSKALFVAPIPDDRIFVELCKKGNFGSWAAKYGKKNGIELTLSEDLIDLLKGMLKADPKERLTLAEIMEHPWVKNEELMSPTEWLKKKEPSKTDDSAAKPTDTAESS